MPYSFDFVYLIVCLCKCNKKPLVFPLCHPLFCATLKSKAHTKCVSFVVYGGYMRVFDFDNTIYDGESVFDFFLFCVKKQKYLLKYMPLMIKDLIFYKMRLLTEEKLYEQASGLTKEIVKNREHANDYIEEFWRLNSHKLKSEFLDMIEESDIIITASPAILIEGVGGRLKTKNIIGSVIDLDTGELKFMCFRSNKAKAFNKAYPKVKIDEFYTDSLNDMPLINAAEKAFLVKKGKITAIEK